MNLVLSLAFALGMLCLTGCMPSPPIHPPPTEPPPIPAPAPPPEEPDLLPELLHSMTLEEKVGQMFFLMSPGSPMEALIQEYAPGGVLLFGRDFSYQNRDQVVDQLAIYQTSSTLPLLIGVDEEGGTVNRVSRNPKLVERPFLSPQKLYHQGGMEAILQDVSTKSDILLALGINVNFAPVADVSTHPNDFIYQRTFGQDASATADYVAQVVTAMNQKPIGSVLKHFPGYGNNEDTHTGVAQDHRPFNTFLTQDLLPFQTGIQAGAGAVMVAHTIVSSMDPQFPASLSPAVHTLLREDLSFSGVILTDDLSMEGVQAYHTLQPVAVLAVLAGNDMLVTANIQEQFPQILEAVAQGTISEEQIDASVLRILQWKDQLGLLEDAPP